MTLLPSSDGPAGERSPSAADRPGDGDSIVSVQELREVAALLERALGRRAG